MPDVDDKITSGYRSGMQLHDQDPCHLLEGLLFYTVAQKDNSRLIFGDNFGIVVHKYPYNHILGSHLHHLSVAVLLGEAILLSTNLNAFSVMNSDKQSLTLNVIAYDISETSLRADL